MAEIEFSIDPTTGELQAHITGMPGASCEDAARILKEFFGQHAKEQKTAEYFVRPRNRPNVRPKGSA